MKYRWKYRGGKNPDAIATFARQLNIYPILADLLMQRGIDNFDKAKAFFRPQLEELHDPFLMKDMDVAVDRLVKAIDGKERIMVYGDYDVDGSSAVATFYGFLSKFYDGLIYYIPDRYGEGYGVSEKGIDFAHEKGITLIVSLDCGIKATAKIQRAKDLGIDFIICDHHNPPEVLPPAVAILDPKRKDCLYPFKELTGCGVGFKLLHAFTIRKGISYEKLLQELDLVALSIAADIVPVTGENRVLTRYGLEIINSASRVGLKALINEAKLALPLNIGRMVFGIAPRINAAGRMVHAKEAVRLLISDDPEEAKLFAMNIEQQNLDRRSEDKKMTVEALAMLDEKESVEAPQSSSVLYQEGWHKGLIGIVASRCIEKYYRPTIILSKSNGTLAGSARSVKGFDLYEAISACQEHLVQFGGHKYAAGLTMKEEQLPAFKAAFEAYAEANVTPEQKHPQLIVEGQLDFDKIGPKMWSILKQFSPFGPQNMRPVFKTEPLFLVGTPRILKDEHLKITVRQQGFDQTFEAIGFGMAMEFANVQNHQPFEMAYQIDLNEFRGQKSYQLLIKDFDWNTND